MAKKRVDFVKSAEKGEAHHEGSRHHRRANQANKRWLQKMKQKHPAEYAEAMKRIKERFGE